MIRIKFLSKYQPGNDGADWIQRFPGAADGNTTLGNCHFIFDRNERRYDWLVVWDDLPSLNGERRTMWEEELACPRRNTMLVTTEPSTIKVYGKNFVNQFGHVWTSQESWAVADHPGIIREQTSYVWFYSHGLRGSYDRVRAHLPLKKNGEISAVCSNKQQKHTLHRRRYEFMMGLKAAVPDMELFGRGVRFVEDKADALDPYKYHVAIENFYGLHHWTEKLADPFLGACMPIYYGCPNAEDYFPEESFLRIDINDLSGATEIIQKAIKDKLYEQNLDAVLEARRRVIEEYAPVIRVSKMINNLHDPDSAGPQRGEMIISRHAIRKRSILNGFSDLMEKAVVSLRHKKRSR